jgi:hypothetical protein
MVKNQFVGSWFPTLICKCNCKRKAIMLACFDIENGQYVLSCWIYHVAASRLSRIPCRWESDEATLVGVFGENDAFRIEVFIKPLKTAQVAIRVNGEWISGNQTYAVA